MCARSSTTLETNLIDDSDDEAIAAELESLESLVSLSPEVVQLLDEVCILSTLIFLNYSNSILFFIEITFLFS